LNYGFVSFALSNVDFDFANFTSPINNYVSEAVTVYLRSDFTQYATISLSSNEGTWLDTHLQYSQHGKHRRFIGSQFSRDGFSSYFFSSYLSVTFKMSRTYIVYERTVESLLAFLGTMGGTIGLMFIVGAWLAKNFTEKLFLYSILSNLYQVDLASRTGEKYITRERTRRTIRRKRLTSFKILGNLYGMGESPEIKEEEKIEEVKI